MPFYSIYRIDEHNNFHLVCGAGSKELAEESLKKHPGYEESNVVWENSLIYGQVFHSPIQRGIISDVRNV